MKRLLDLALSFVGLVLTSPLWIPVSLAIYFQDWHSPFYVASRVGKNERPFKMVKLRSMVMNADRSGVDSTSSKDPRITPVGKFVRRYKLDELPQLWNVLKGEMSLVGPRPNVKRETDLYTTQEKLLLTVCPGITDFSSIVFSDENDILKDSADPDIDYNQLIRPWKSRLGIFYVQHASVWLDIRLIALTVSAILSRESALTGVVKVLRKMSADEQLVSVAKRMYPLKPFPPPGATKIIASRDWAPA